MRRRNPPRALTVEDMPVHLRDLDPVAWGWSGPHYEDGYLCEEEPPPAR